MGLGRITRRRTGQFASSGTRLASWWAVRPANWASSMKVTFGVNSPSVCGRAMAALICVHASSWAKSVRMTIG